MAIFNSHVKLPEGISFGKHKLQKTSASRTTCGWPTGTSVPAPNQHNRQQDQPNKRPRQYLAPKKQGSWLVVHTFQKMLNISSQSYQKAWNIEVRIFFPRFIEKSLITCPAIKDRNRFCSRWPHTNTRKKRTYRNCKHVSNICSKYPPNARLPSSR